MSNRPARRCLDLALSQPWAITPEGLQLIVSVASRAQEVDVEALEAQLGQPLEHAQETTVRDGVATIEVSGPMFRRADALTALSGATSYQRIASDFHTALTDPAVHAILFAMDSHGGEVAGISDLVAMIVAARGEKQIVAHVDGMAASAAYWIASAADRVIASDTALLGSLGVVATFLDTSEADEAMGYREIKIISNQTPMKQRSVTEPEGRAQVQRHVDQIAGVFIRSVADNRGMSAKAVVEAYGDGSVFVAGDAVRNGAADRIATFETIHAELVAQGRKQAQQSLFAATAAAPPSPVRLRRAAHAAIAPLTGSLAATSGSVLRVPQAVVDALATLPDSSRLTLSGSLPAPTADEPKEQKPMETKDTGLAAPAPGATIEEAKAQARAEEKARVLALRAIRAEHPTVVTDEVLDAWIDHGTTEAVAGKETLALIRQQAAANPTRLPVATGVHDRAEDETYASLGEQLVDVRAAAMHHTISPRLRGNQARYAAATGHSEGVPADGGFFVQKDSATDLLENVWENSPILQRVDQRPIGPNANGIKLKGVDESSRVDGSRAGGLRGYWGAEGGTLTASKAKYREIDMTLHKVHALTYHTEEELMDAPAVQANVAKNVPRELRFKVEDAIINGDGSGKPLGIVGAPGTVSVTPETGQLAATIVIENIVKMWARLFASSKPNAIWLNNVDTEPELFTMGITFGTGGQAVYLPGGTIANAPFGSLMGRPVVPVEYCQTLGTVGDLILVDFTGYLLITKGGIRESSSIHVQFTTDEEAFKWTWRVDGQPLLRTAITPTNGTNDLSHVVTLATRA